MISVNRNIVVKKGFLKTLDSIKGDAVAFALFFNICYSLVSNFVFSNVWLRYMRF